MPENEALDEYLIALFEKHKQYDECKNKYYFGIEEYLIMRKDPNLSEKQKVEMVLMAVRYARRLNQSL